MRKLYVLFCFLRRYKNISMFYLFSYVLCPKKSINSLTRQQILAGEYETMWDAFLRMLAQLCYQITSDCKAGFLLLREISWKTHGIQYIHLVCFPLPFLFRKSQIQVHAVSFVMEKYELSYERHCLNKYPVYFWWLNSLSSIILFVLNNKSCKCINVGIICSYWRKPSLSSCQLLCLQKLEFLFLSHPSFGCQVLQTSWRFTCVLCDVSREEEIVEYSRSCHGSKSFMLICLLLLAMTDVNVHMYWLCCKSLTVHV